MLDKLIHFNTKFKATNNKLEYHFHFNKQSLRTAKDFYEHLYPCQFHHFEILEMVNLKKVNILHPPPPRLRTWYTGHFADTCRKQILSSPRQMRHVNKRRQPRRHCGNNARKQKEKGLVYGFNNFRKTCMKGQGTDSSVSYKYCICWFETHPAPGQEKV